jgi:hypothetical protein
VRLATYLPFRVGLFVLVGNGALISAPPDSSISASRQFIVYGTTAPLRGAVADVAEKTKAHVLSLLQQRDGWKTPIILNLQFPQANVPDLPAAALRFSQTGSGLKIQIDLTIAHDFDAVAIRRQLLRGILLELIYRRNSDLPAGSFYVEPPDWLIEGLLGADPMQDRGGMIESVSSLATEGKIAPLDRFLQQQFALLDSPGQLLYRAYALAFLQLLVNEPGGTARLATYIENLSRASSDPESDLKVYFPILARTAEVDALWKTSVASLATRRYQLLTAAETERQLAELVATEKSRGVSSEAKDLTKYIKKKLSAPESAELRQLGGNLTVLGIEANPSFRTLIMEYEQIVERIRARKTKGLPARLAVLASRREKICARSSDIDDYMNWFEATKSNATSGAFSGYLRAATRSDELRSRRRDPISVYLDALEEQF